ncbi:MND1 [Candida margitis]|uniref:MND1 n=1 Tax=Candida margitis TaxID=1775924 RepID=UPI0022265EA7|nr:MND1 [Candida margitis]KAI5968252.1 MND1 [Candida margitis]
MTPKKTVSHEEKLELLHTWFQSAHDFYTLKEIEQKASKACKIPSIQVKELVSNLVDEGLIQQEKSGTTNLYWSFQYTTTKNKIGRARRIQHDLEAKRKLSQQMQKDLEVLRAERSVDALPERENQLQELSNLQADIDQLTEQNKQLEQYQQIENLKTSIEFFTDSIETILSWLSTKSGISKVELRKEFGIPENLDDSA